MKSKELLIVGLIAIVALLFIINFVTIRNNILGQHIAALTNTRLTRDSGESCNVEQEVGSFGTPDCPIRAFKSGVGRVGSLDDCAGITWQEVQYEGIPDGYEYDSENDEFSRQPEKSCLVGIHGQPSSGQTNGFSSHCFSEDMLNNAGATGGFDDTHFIDWSANAGNHEAIVQQISDEIQDAIDDGCTDIKIVAHSAGGYYASVALADSQGANTVCGKKEANIELNTVASSLNRWDSWWTNIPGFDSWCDQQGVHPACGYDYGGLDGSGVDVTNYITTGSDGVIPDGSQPSGEGTISISTDHCSAVAMALYEMGLGPFPDHLENVYW
jgi:hypothetical protein